MKQQQSVNAKRKDYEAISEVRDYANEKKRILTEAHLTLKRDIYSRKQNHKISVMS